MAKPSDYFNTTGSLFYFQNRTLADYQCQFILETQQENGAWPLPWSWGDYLSHFAIAANWWQSHFIIENLLYLKGFGKI